MRKSKSFRPTLNDKLEDRTVPSHLLGGFLSSQVATFHGGFGLHGGQDLGGDLGLHGGQDLGGDLGLRGGRDHGGLNLPGNVGASSSTLGQDARAVQQAFQTFRASYLAAAAALRQTATTTAG